LSATNNEVVQHAYVNQLQGGFEPPRDAFICLAGLGDTRRVIVRQNDRRGVDGEGFFDDFSRIDTGAIYRPPKHLVETQHPVTVVQIQATEQLVAQVPHPRLQESTRVIRAADSLAGWQGLFKVTPGEFRQRPENGCFGGTDAAFRSKCGRIGLQQLAKPAEARQEPLGQCASGTAAVAPLDEQGE